MRSGKHHVLALVLILCFLLAGLPAYASGEASQSTPLVVSEDMQLDELTIQSEDDVVPADGYSLIMLVDGVVTKPEPGTYQNVQLILQPEDYIYGAYDETGNEEGHVFRFLYNTGDEDTFLADAFGDNTAVTEENGYTVLDGGGDTVVVNDDYINTLSVENDNAIIRNINVTVNGIGVCEYGNAFGGAITIAGDESNVIIDNVNVTTTGAIMSTLNSSAGNVLVMDSTFHGYGTAEDASGLHSGIPSYSNVGGSLTEVPWVLGLRGSLRATNVIGTANVMYYNCETTSNGWGAYSTDGGTSFILLNCDASYDDSQGAEFESMYGAYILGLPSYLYGYHVDLSEAEGNTYGIVARYAFTLGSSSQENLEALNELITTTEVEEASEQEAASDESTEDQPATISAASGTWALFEEQVGHENVVERRSYIRAMYGIMSHGTSGEQFHISDTDIVADRAAILMKESFEEIFLDGTVTIDAPIIIHEQITDDASMGTLAYDSCWAAATQPFLYEVEDTGVTPEEGVTAHMTDMKLEGDFYNTDTNGAYLDLDFTGTEITGVISSGTFLHNNASFYLVENPAFDTAAEEGEDNMRYICVDKDGTAYKTALTYTLFGQTNYHPDYVDEDGIVTFLYDEDGLTFDQESIVGYAIFYNDAQYCSDGVITPCQAINNPVYAALSGDTVWNVTGNSYLARLTVEAGSVINGVVTVDGEIVDVSAGGTWEGEILVTPAAASGEAS